MVPGVGIVALTAEMLRVSDELTEPDAKRSAQLMPFLCAVTTADGCGSTQQSGW